MAGSPYVYILASKTRVLYIGVTSDLTTRMFQHKSKSIPGFTARYNVDRLVYRESFETMTGAIAREKQLKGWTRKKKIALIEEFNPEWNDFAEEWWEEMKIDKPSS